MQLGPVGCREAHIGQHVGLAVVHQGGQLGQRRPELVGDHRQQSCRSGAAGTPGVRPGEGAIGSWRPRRRSGRRRWPTPDPPFGGLGTPVAMKAATTRRPFLPAWARALRAKCTRQRCQEAWSSLAMAVLSPSWASEITNFTPRRPRCRSLRRKAVQKVSASDGPMSIGLCPIPRRDVSAADRAEHFPPAVAVDADRDDHRGRHDPTVLADLHIGGVEPEVGPIALDRPVEKGLHLAVWTCPLGVEGWDENVMQLRA